MRKFKLLLISVLFPCMCMGEGAYHEDNEFISNGIYDTFTVPPILSL